MSAIDTDNNIETTELAERIVRSGLKVPAVFFLELHKPLSNLLYHATLALTPALSPLFGLQRLQNCSVFLANPANIENLIVAIETRSQQRK